MFNKELLADGISQLNIPISDRQLEQFEKYCSLLIEKNKVMNLTSIVDEDEVIKKHFLDSLLVANVIDLNQIESVIDIGTGAGFPGIPLKIAFPNLKITLLDSLDKRIGFLREVADELELDNIEMVHGRAEDYGQDDNYRESYDLCVSRAVADLAVLSEYCIPLVKVGGSFISYKAENSLEEISNANNAVEILGGKIESQETCKIPGDDINRRFVSIKKVSSTDSKYPRRAGKPTKKPLK